MSEYVAVRGLLPSGLAEFVKASETFHSGDVVRLRSGGSQMVVLEIVAANVKLAWMDPFGVLRTETLTSASIELVR